MPGRPKADRRAQECLYWSDERLRAMLELQRAYQARGMTRQEAARRAYADVRRRSKPERFE